MRDLARTQPFLISMAWPWVPMAIVTLLATGALAADPYTPTDDEEVLEVLPQSLLEGREELAALRNQLAIDPSNSRIANEVAIRYMQIGDKESDPRFFGYARAAIGQWWEVEVPPDDILKLRAKLKEKDHGYADAATDLTLLLQKQPRNVQAWINLANIYRVLGRYDESQQACDSLSTFAGVIPQALCHAPLQMVTGHAEQALDSLTAIVPHVRVRSPGTLQWVMTMQGELCVALGRDREAEDHFRESLSIDPSDKYLLRAYSDFLLDHDRPREVLPLVRNHESDSGLLLCAAIACRASGNLRDAEAMISQLTDRFEESRLRGGQSHGRYEARFELKLRDNPNRALEIALVNWSQQKEVNDTRILLESAIAAKRYAETKPVTDFLEANRTDHAVLQSFARQLIAQ